MTPAAGPGVFLQSRVGRRGIPTAASFEGWVRAALHGRSSQRREVNIIIVGRPEGRALNRRHRGKDHATNVLSFPYEPLPGEQSRLLGELALCAPVVAREAARQGKETRDHYAHLTVHGVLHLLGYDHASDTGAARMEALERRILDGLGVPDPYALRKPETGNR
jgi:probable rRNA maturation factor